MLSVAPALDTDPLTAAQTVALVKGIDVLAQRLTQIQESGLLDKRAAGLGESLGTLSPIGDQLRTGLAERLASLSGAVTVLDVKNAFTKAAADDPVLALSSLKAERETLPDQSRLWFTATISGSKPLPSYRLDLGQVPSTTATPSLLDRGLHLGDVKPTVTVGYEGTLGFGIDLAPGLSQAQTFFLKFDALDVLAKANHSGASAVQDVDASFGIMRLGPADLDVSLDTRVRIDLAEGADGVVALGELDGTASGQLASLLPQTAAGSGLSVTVPFKLGFGGFTQAVGSDHQVVIKATDSLDPASLALTLPSLTLAGGATPFDFAKLADIKDNDLGGFLADLGHWVPELGREFEVPLVAKPFASLFGGDMLKRVDDLVAGLKSSASSWAFTTADDMVEKLAAALGTSVTALDLRWNGDANAVQWKLPLDFTKTVSESFDPGAIVPAGLPLEVAAKGSVSLTASTALSITAGVSARVPVSSTAVTSATLLSALNGGAGLTKNALIPGDDIQFALRDGTTIGFDLDAITGLGTDSLAGSATVAGLLTLLNGPSAAGKLSVTLAENRLMVADLTAPASKDSTVSVTAPQAVVMAEDGMTEIKQTSLAPAALGLTVVPAADAALQGKPLASQPLRERIYVAAGDVGTATVTLSASLEAGASLGPLSLAIHKGAATGSAGITLKLTDPATVPGTASRVALAEMDAGIAKLVGFKLAAPKLDGIFQLKVRPEALAKDVLGIDDTKYQPDPLTVAPSTADVPFVRVQAEAGDAWKFKAAPSQKLEQTLQGMSDLSLDDLPKMLALFAGYLKAAPFWDVTIPWDGRTLGTFLGIESALQGFASLDLKAILGRPDALGAWPAASLNGLGKAFRAQIDATLPQLSALPQFGRLQRLSWALGDLMVRWEGWTPGVQGLDLDFIGDLRAWAVEANLVFSSLPADAAIKDVRLAFGRLLAFDHTKDVAWLNGLNLATLNLGGLDLGGLGGFGSVIKSLLPALPGITVDVTPSLAEVTPGGAKALAFDATVTYAGFSKELDLDALAIDGTPFAVKGSGGIAIKLDGSITGRFGLNLSTKAPFFDAAKSSISLAASIDDTGGVTLAASLGGIAGVSFGKMGDTLARVSLKNASSDPAQFKVTGTGVVTADAVFAATLPIYVTAPDLGKVGTFAIDATLDTTKPDPFALAVSFQAGAYASLADVFAAAISSFSLTSWLDGAILLTKTLRSTLESKFIRQLPLLSDVGSAAVPALGALESFFEAAAPLDTPKVLAEYISSRASATLGLSTPLKFFVNNAEVSSASTTKFSQLLTKTTDELVVDLTLVGNSTKAVDVGEIDLGLDALGLKLRGGLGIDLAAGFTLHLGLGFSVAQGFFLKTYDSQELAGTVSLAFSGGSSLALDLGALTLGLTDKNGLKKELEAALGIDLPAAQTTIAGLPGLLTAATPTGTVRAQLDLDLKANILGSGPGIGMVVALGYTQGGVPDAGAVSLTNLNVDNFFFEIADTYIDLGSLLSGPVFTLFQKIENFLDPIEPVLDLLQQEMPVVSDVSKFAGLGAVSVLDAIRYTSQGQYDDAIKFIQILTLVNEVANSLGSFGGSTAKISLGGLSFDKLAAAASGKGLEALFGKDSADAEAMLKQLEAVAKGDILKDPAQLLADKPAADATATAYAKVTKGKLSFPVFDDPAKAIVDLIFGRNPNLIYWDMPDLLAGAEFNLPIPIFGPLFAEIFGSISFATDFKMGLDTRGIRQALSGGTIDVGAVVGVVSKGIFFEDDPTPGDGLDPTELRVDARVGAGAYLDVVVASGGVRGGVEGYVGANLKDPDGDGKVHLDEFLDNLSDGIDCIFDFEGRLDAFFEAWVKLGLSTPFGMITLWSKTFDLVDETIVDWEYVTCPPPAPVIAEIATGGVYDADNDGTAGESLPDGFATALVLNAGPRAGRVLPGETADGDEVFEVDYDAASNTYIVKAYYAEEDRDKNGTIDPAEKANGISFSATGIQAIVFDAGIGNDTILISPLVTIPVYGWGGPGNDSLTGGAGSNTLFGDGGLVPGAAGRDSLTGRKAADTLSGGGDGDMILGYGGSDTIDGGDGDDMLYGEDEVGDMAAFIAANPTFEAGTGGIDFIVGGAGDDRIVGGLDNDALCGDAGDDVVDGGDGNDVIEGGVGNDTLYGRDGDDVIHGDDMLGAITAGGIDVNADLIEGGTGFNIIHGGPGYDVIYAAGATQKAAAPSTGTSGGYSSRLFGGDGCDTIYGTAGKDWIEGGFESDSIESGTGGDEVLGGPGGDCIIVAGGDARIFGGHGNDVIDAGDGVNYVEGGPGDDRIYARGGADTVYGGTTGVGYVYLQQDLASGKPVIAAIHGGFTAVAAEGSCGATVLFHPEVYPDAPHTITGTIFNDLDADAVRDAGEPGTPATDSWTLRIIEKSTLADVMIVTVPGGDFSLPSAAGLPAGTYYVVVDAVPAGWSPSNAWSSMVAEVTLGGAAPAATPALGFFKPGRLTGKVVTRTGTQDSATAGIPVYLDTNKDGVRQPDEPLSSTAGDGSYAFTGLKPGSYRIDIADPRVCAVVTPGFHDATLLSGGTTQQYDFRITPTLAPVVDGVLLGKAGSAVTWTPVPDGAKQLAPLAGSFSLIAFETCISSGTVTATSGATLRPVSSTGSLGQAVSLTFAGVDPTKSNRYVYQMMSQTAPVTLTAGRYRFTVADASVQSAGGAKLDGNWTNPGPTTAPGGSQFPSGDGSAGGDFVFDFVIAGPTGQAALANLSWTPPATGAAAGGTIQGTVWRHDDADAAMGRSATEPGLTGHLIRLTDANGTTVATTTSGPRDLDGDGLIEDAELGGFAFTNVAAGTYTVSQEPVHPWVQATPGGTTAPESLYAVSHTSSLGKNTLWSLNVAARSATKVRDFQTLVARDVAFTTRDTAWISGTSVSTVVGTPGVAGLWRMDFGSGTLVSMGAIPGGQPLLALDALDADTLLGVSLTGEVLLYHVPLASWESRGPLRTSANQLLYPVGDVVAFGPGEMYLICLTQQNLTMSGQLAASQILVRLDPGMLGANSTVVRDFRTVTELLVGLERDAGGGLVAVGASNGVFTFAASAAGSVTRTGTLSGATTFTYGGLAMMPAATVADPWRKDFLVTVASDETVTVGFGDRPHWEVLEDGDDVIDGGCGDDADILHGDDGSGLPWNVKTIGGHDVIRGRAGDDQISGGQQGDVILGEGGNDFILGGTSAGNRIDGGAGDDWLGGGAAGDVISGGDGNDTISGADGGDVLFGDAGDDWIQGGEDGDVLCGGTGVDWLWGEGGDDTLFLVDTVLGGGYGMMPGADADSFDGGGGLDTIVTRADIDMRLTNAAITVSGTAHVVAWIENALLTGGASANFIEALGFSGTSVIRGLDKDDILYGGTGIDLILGGPGNDLIAGSGSADDLRGEDGDDDISGNDGADSIRGGAGMNRLDGGSESDLYVFTGAFDDEVVETAAGGIDVLDLTALAGSLIGVIDSAGVRLSGWSPMLAVRHSGNQVERIRLGTGDDAVFLENGVFSAARIDAGGGEDTLSYGGYGGPAWSAGVAVNLGTGVATGITGGIAGFEDITGGDGGDTLTGDAAANVIVGGKGNDTISGGAGNDQLSGEDGNDSVTGGADNDLLSGGGGTNTLAGDAGDDTYFFWATGATDTVNEAAAQGTDVLDFMAVTGVGMVATIGGSINASFGSSPNSTSVAVPTAAGIDCIRGTAQTDRFRVADGAAFAGILEGGGIPGYGFADMDILDLSAWTAAVTVSYLGALDASFLGSATGTGGVRNLRHVIGGTKADVLRAGELPVWFEGLAGNDLVVGSAQGDRLDGGDGDDSIVGLAGNDLMLGGPGADTLAGGLGHDTYGFADLFGADTILEDSGEGNDTMDFSAVLAALTVSLGSVTVTAGGNSATHAGTAIESVIGGAGDDTFVMTSPSVTFPGTLDGGAGGNTLRYDKATPTLITQVNNGQTPNVGMALKFSTVTAVPAFSQVDVSVPSNTSVSYGASLSGNQRIVKTGSGTLFLSLANSHTEGTAVEAGELVVKNVSALGTGGLEIAAGAKAAFDVGFASIKIDSLKLDGLLDIGSGGLTVTSGLTSSALLAAMRDGYGDGSWNGIRGITSSSAADALAAGIPRAIGWLDNGDGSISLQLTVPGDANVDGIIDILDVVNFVAGGRFNSGEMGAWTEGDFNYDEVVDMLDVVEFVSSFVYQSTALSQAATPKDTAGTSVGRSPLEEAFAAYAMSATNSTGETTSRKKRTPI